MTKIFERARPVPVMLAVLALLAWSGAARAQAQLQDLAVQYHGTILDRDNRWVDIQDPDLDRLFVELADRVMAETDVPDILRVYYDQTLPPLDPATGTRPAPGNTAVDLNALDFLIDEALFGADPSPARAESAALLRMLRSVAGDRLNPGAVPAFDGLSRERSGYRSRREFTYMPCDVDDVPQPPDLNDPRWGKTFYVDLALSLLQNDEKDIYYTRPAEVRFSESTEKPGLCAQLIRYKQVREPYKDLPSELALAGVICQSATSKSTCFWENWRLDEAGNPEVITLDMLENDPTSWKVSTTWFNSASAAVGSDLKDPCTYCHNGNNAFIQYPGRLCFDEPGDTCYGDKYLGPPLIVPVGPPPPEPLDWIKSEPGKRTCVDCHGFGIAVTESNAGRDAVCGLFQHVIEQKLMPKNESHAENLSWTGDIPDGAEYRDSVMTLRDRCK
ncbi:MAG: hypothetical protein KDK53_03150 [Maritimibacter sp.]|nr:hypothetical protein [Maritimibacter sp.]